ncbi:general L-amino acid transport system permease protein [Thalassospira xiamenensis M-5 = DSM 17429]|uniref:Polar amino acid ABC transporter inner membrane subunit n=1 Tax=Thalassospira xiamenensis M-5 = DSM 17429 TaxID=1123366 RepID=A0AB72UF87_9PROT|nr:ABC transporter permease subunit [Thalassospira xiamenensis]AJD53006.1 polar amino acid ABC transporter inner membrane subunit [Thalassospira xiamenensis M-5 = DSM 17429]SIT32959.1 general L-amino acid transport system permease protein [Thalassospira xiamenensis M-5 = DSM 17429]
MNFISPSRPKPGIAHSIFSCLNKDSTRGVVIQAATLGLVLAVLLYLFSNSAQNLDRLGLSFGFDFLQTTAGFDISWSLIAYDPSMSYWRVFLVGIVNTLFLSFCVIVFGTLIGTIVGILRLSHNPLVSQLARCYVEVVRNVPLLIQIIFWFTTVFSALPPPRSGYGFAGLIFLNNRGFYMPSAVSDMSGWLIAAVSLILLGTLWFLLRSIRRQQRQNGSVSRSYRIAFALWGLVLCGMALIVGSSLRWSVPALQGFNIEGGMFLPSAFGAAFIAMTVYRSAAIAETVRAGMESISKGQHEAAATIGFSRFQTLRLILIPQAVRAIIPPLANSWLVATKDSSLAVAIGFPELVSVFMQTSVNQTGRAIEIISMVMGFYVVVSLIISYLLNKYNAHVQIKAR